MTRARDGMLVGIALLAFVSIGLPDGVLGVAWPSVRASFDLPLSELGVMLTAATLGYLVSSFSSRFGLEVIGPLLFAATTLLLLLHEIAERWPGLAVRRRAAGPARA